MAPSRTVTAPEKSQHSETSRVVHLPDLPGVDCPCGTARRAFAGDSSWDGTVHLTSIRHDARTHYHKRHTEVYVVLECEEDASLELDGESVPVRRHSAVLIPPGVRHRAVGRMEVLILCSPDFDPADEFFDD